MFLFLPEELTGRLRTLGREAALKLFLSLTMVCAGEVPDSALLGHGMRPGFLLGLLALENWDIKMSESGSECHCHADGNFYKRQ